MVSLVLICPWVRWRGGVQRGGEWIPCNGRIAEREVGRLPMGCSFPLFRVANGFRLSTRICLSSFPLYHAALAASSWPKNLHFPWRAS